MNNLKLIIPLVIIFILLGVGAYTIYRAQVKPPIEKEPTIESTSSATFGASPSASPKGVTSSAYLTPSNQPATGSDELQIKNIGITVNSPTNGQQLTSPFIITGRANVTSETVIITVFDSIGAVIGLGKAEACVGLDACPFKASIRFDKPTTTSGTLEVYSPSTIDNSKTYPLSIPITF